MTLGLATQLELEAVVRKAADKQAKEARARGEDPDGPSLRPASETGVLDDQPEVAEAPEYDLDRD